MVPTYLLDNSLLTYYTPTMFDPEHESIATFAEFMVDDERTEFTHADIVQLAEAERKSYHVVRVELEGWGFKLAKRPHEKNVRGVSSNDNDRWYGPGAEKMHGGSGHEQIAGFAGQEG